jgi:inward rectifier potassium channel
MGFAVVTGLLVGRVAQPSAKIAFSEFALVAPYEAGTSLQFRIANQRSNSLMELEAKVLPMTVDETSQGLKRDYALPRLERAGVFFFRCCGRWSTRSVSGARCGARRWKICSGCRQRC